jgi:hypothetical protein
MSVGPPSVAAETGLCVAAGKDAILRSVPAKTHTAPNLDWDGLRFVLRVASEGSVAAAEPT